ncbi:MarR family transcriptional regulator [Plantactinospora sp. BC1]|uniref:winged helix-turn-helix domain-containing protein n=1 Tax=Plantactinospora sp. BC1 TaxID=2108470 RepID=UPI000D17277B|nr:transcriptional regulator [Plantactinospora sp. BC1]AVT28557.1 MarR family transcriptional regulator [Plantactinospora sp. BC1]
MTRPRFDELIHAPARLSLVALLAPADAVEFSYLREQLGLSDSALSKHVSALGAAGYVTVHKENRGRGIRRTWVTLTDAGLTAFDGHVAALDEIVARARPSGGRPAGTPGTEDERDTVPGRSGAGPVRS